MAEDRTAAKAEKAAAEPAPQAVEKPKGAKGSVSAWFALLSAMGITQVVGRYVPRFVVEGDVAALKGFLSQLVSARLASGLLAAAAF